MRKISGPQDDAVVFVCIIVPPNTASSYICQSDISNKKLQLLRMMQYPSCSLALVYTYLAQI